MASIVWPPSLPQAPLLSAYRKRLPELKIRSTVDAGLDKVRRRYTAGPTIHSVQFLLTRTQVALLRTFYMETTANGSLPFDWIDHETGNQATFRFIGSFEYLPRAPRGNGNEYWETVVLTLEEVPAASTDSSGDPPPSRFVGLYNTEELFESQPDEEEPESFISFVPSVVVAPNAGYYPWLIPETTEDLAQEDSGSDYQVMVRGEASNNDIPKDDISIVDQDVITSR